MGRIRYGIQRNLLSPQWWRGNVLTRGGHGHIFNRMVNYHRVALDRTFAALADPTRRALLARLGEEDALTVSELARPIAMSLPAVMKHLDVLAQAGLVTRRKTGRSVVCRLQAGPMREAMAWLEHHERFWSARLDSLASLVEAEEEETR